MNEDRVTFSTIASSMTTFAILALLVYALFGEVGIPLVLLILVLGVVRQALRFLKGGSEELQAEAARQPASPEMARNFGIAGAVCVATGITIFLGMRLPGDSPLVGEWGFEASILFATFGIGLLAAAKLVRT